MLHTGAHVTKRIIYFSFSQKSKLPASFSLNAIDHVKIHLFSIRKTLELESKEDSQIEKMWLFKTEKNNKWGEGFRILWAFENFIPKYDIHWLDFNAPLVLKPSILTC